MGGGYERLGIGGKMGSPSQIQRKERPISVRREKESSPLDPSWVSHSYRKRVSKMKLRELFFSVVERCKCRRMWGMGELE